MSEAPPFFTRYGFGDLDPAALTLTVTPYPEICVAGTLRATVVVSAIDLLGAASTREIAGTPPHPRSHHAANLVEFDEEEDGDAEKKIFIIGG